MAWTVTAQGFTEGAYQTAQNVGNTLTPTQDDLMLVVTIMNDGTSHTSVTGWGATFSEILAPVNATAGYLTAWLARIGASPGSGTANIDFGGSSTNHSSCVIQIAGASTTAGIGVGGTNVVRQVTSSAAYDTTSPFSITALAAFGSATNLSLTLGGIFANFGLAPKAGFTEVLEASGTTYNPNVWVAYKTSSDTAHQLVNQSAGDFAGRYVVGAALEIVEAGGGGGGTTATGVLGLLGVGA